jgi:hypothetical protein
LKKARENHSSPETGGKYLQSGTRISAYDVDFVMPIALMAPFIERTMVILRQTWIYARDAVFVTANAGLALSAW